MRKGTLGLSLLVVSAALAGCLGAPQPAPEPGEPREDRDPVDGLTPTGTPPPAAGLPPVAAFTWTPAPAIAGKPTVFVDQSTDGDDGPAGRVWQFPDGSTHQLLRVAFTFADPGRYLVKLTVSDRGGLTDTLTQEVLVVPEDAVPHESLGLDPGTHVVVAVVDTGINPYHAAFRAARPMGIPASFLEQYPVDARPLALSLGAGSYQAARDADERTWADVVTNQLYYVPGTRIVGAISFGLSTFGNAAPNTVPILDEDGHGTATSSRVAYAAPDALLVMVEAGAEEFDEAVAWASSQPWIDIVSISAGPVANVPAAWPSYALGASQLGTSAAWESGKLVFAAAGNEPTPTTGSQFSGPAWVIAVGGAYPNGRGEPGTASKAMDIVSDYAPEAAVHDSTDATEPRSGTSFSAPNAAGAAAQALYLLRSHTGWTRGIEGGALLPSGPGLLAEGLTNAELRHALEGVARYWDTAEWSPVSGLPIAPAPWVQMGWGYFGPEDVPALVQALESGHVPEKPGEAQVYQAAMLQTRMAMWG